MSYSKAETTSYKHLYLSRVTYNSTKCLWNKWANQQATEQIISWTESFPFLNGLFPFLSFGPYHLPSFRASLLAQLVKNPPAMQETPVWFLGWEDPLDKGKATFLVSICWDRMISISSSPSHFLLYPSCTYLIFIYSFNLLKILKWLTDWGGCSQGDLSIRQPRYTLGTQQTFKNSWKCSHFFNQKKNKIMMII